MSQAAETDRQLKRFIPYLSLFRQAFSNFSANDPVRMAGATAFFAFFALPSIVVILNKVLGTFVNTRHHSMSRQLFGQLAELFGPQSARQLQDISRHLQARQTDRIELTITIVVLLLSATTLFAVVKNSLNQLWNVKATARHSVLYGLRDRLVALCLILASGLLFLLSATLVQRLSLPMYAPTTVTETWESISEVPGFLRFVISFVVMAVWFAMLFTVIPDVRVPASAVRVGAGVTSALFLLGEWTLTRLLTYGQLRTLHGGAGAITLVLLFVFYCSLIFYYGAAFTRQYAKWAHADVSPGSHAVGYTITEVDEEKGAV
ncbi:serum resistance protein [Fibrella aestuarina BUZ 2]|uniref:Serum resistance protein n=1 Tax=Fibrella aestuarina BUZ 2 TaxID=1166018 RepID=I0KGZ3_9BACT|nr:serum resistance protein [Fibrella aestuarina BUZ 2]